MGGLNAKCTCSGYDNVMNKVWDNNNRGVRIFQTVFPRVQMLTGENSANGRTSGTSTSKVVMKSRQSPGGGNKNYQNEDKSEGIASARGYGSFTRVHSVGGTVVENRTWLADNEFRSRILFLPLHHPGMALLAC